MIYDTIYLQIKNMNTNKNEVMERHIKNRLQKCLENYEDQLSLDDSKTIAKEVRKLTK